MAACVQCWTELNGARFCPDCGTPSTPSVGNAPSVTPATQGAAQPAPTTSARPWWKARWLGGAVVVLVIGLLYGGRFVGRQAGWLAAGQMNGDELGQQISDTYAKQFPGLQLTVECPAEVPIQKNKTVDCTAVNQKGTRSALYVKVLDLEGHVTFDVSDYHVLYPDGP